MTAPIMNKPMHTPWKYLEKDDHDRVCIVDAKGYSVCVCQLSHAALIINAVNSFDAMKEALEALVRQLTIGTFFDELGHNAHNLKALHDARAALARTNKDSQS